MPNPIRPEDLPEVPALTGSAALIVDTGAGVYKASPGEVVEAGDGVTAAALAGSAGSSGVGFLQSGADAIARTTENRLRDTLNLKDFGFTLGTGVAADAAFAAARAQAVAGGIKRIIVPAGHYLLTNFAASADDIRWEGEGESTRIQVGATNSRPFHVTGARNTFRGLKFEGDGTSSASNNGCAIYANAAEDLRVEDVWFTGFGFSAVVAETATAKRGPRIIRTRHRLTAGAANPIEVYLSGAWKGMWIEDADFVTSSANWAIFLADNSQIWRDLNVVRGWFEGYQRYAIGITDEAAATGAMRCAGVNIRGGYYESCLWGAIKTKNSDSIDISGITSVSCGLGAESTLNNQTGAIQIAGGEQVTIRGNDIYGAGYEGIHISGASNEDFSSPDGTGRSMVTLDGNTVDGCGITSSTFGNAFAIYNGLRNVTVTNNKARNFNRYGFEARGSADRPMWDVALSGNRLSQAYSASGGFKFDYVQSVTMDNNRAEQCGPTLLQFNNCGDVGSGAMDRMVDASATGGYGAYVNTVDRSTLLGKYGAYAYPAWVATTAYTDGQRVSTPSFAILECTISGTSGATAPTIATTGSAVDGTVTWRWVGWHRRTSVAIQFAGTVGVAVLGATTDTASSLTAAGLSNVPSGTMTWPAIRAGTATFVSAATVAVAFSPTLVNGNYRVTLTPTANETFWVTARTGSGFTINSSNATSTAAVGYTVSY